MKDYRNVAIARTKHNVVQFAIIEELTGSVVAVVKSMGSIYDITFIETTPTQIKEVMKYLDSESEFFRNF